MAAQASVYSVCRPQTLKIGLGQGPYMKESDYSTLRGVTFEGGGGYPLSLLWRGRKVHYGVLIRTHKTEKIPFPLPNFLRIVS